MSSSERPGGSGGTCGHARWSWGGGSNIDASEIVELKNKAQVCGEICTAKLTVSEGALFDGQSSMKKKKETSEGQEGKVKSIAASRSSS